MVKKLQSYGYQCERVPLSGALGGSLSNDLHLTIDGQMYGIENKRRTQFNRLYSLGTTYIKGFCYVIPEKTFVAMLLSKELNIESEVDDKSFKYLHDFFEQDSSDIVTCQVKNRDYIFCVPKKILDKIGVTTNDL